MASNRIKSLQTTVARGAPFDTARLQDLGISPALAYEYSKGGWLKKLGRGVFMFAGDELKREDTLCFLESRIPGLHVAAKTALAWNGFRHHVASRETTILWGERRATLPDWFTDRFPSRYSSSRIFDDTLEPDFGITEFTGAGASPRISGPERAVLEMLSEVGVHQELEEARSILEGVRQLRMRYLEPLLQNCRQVKAVRLCVAWSRELELPWAEKAREAAASKMGTGRWVGRLKNGGTLILKPE